MEQYNFQHEDEQREKKGGTTMVDFNYAEYAETERKATHTEAVTALTCGILSLVLDIFMTPAGLIAGIVGIVFSIKGLSGGARERGMLIGGLICSVLGTLIGAVSIGAFVLFLLWGSAYYF